MTDPNESEISPRTDWLASEPVFYLADGHSFSHHPGQLINRIDSVAVDPEGLYNYLDFGYSVFSQTPVKGLKFLPPCAQLKRDASGGFACQIGEDPFDKIDDYRLSESDVLELIREKVQLWERGLPAEQEIVLPLSGGLDSRLLLWCLKDPARVRAYTYGGSAKQEKSEDVVFAQAIAERFGLRWEHVNLGNFNKYIDDWIDEFGPTTHAHGMYHYEFYNYISRQLNGRHALLSGIFGDVWAGSIPPLTHLAPSKLNRLGYSHGLKANPEALVCPSRQALREQFWEEERDRLLDPRFQIVTTIRIKMILISYLLRVPRLFDLEPWSPFLDPEVALAMLSLPQKRRDNRLWQREFFKKEGLDIENRGLTRSRSNTLNLDAMWNHPLAPLDVGTLSPYFERGYIEWINKGVTLTKAKYIRGRLAAVPRYGALVRRIGLAPDTAQAYAAYCCLKPIERTAKQAIACV